MAYEPVNMQMTPYTRGLEQGQAQARAKQQNWLTDPEQPWNTWAANLEGYLQDWVNSQRTGLQADLRQQNLQAGQTAIGQGLYQGTYTSSLPAEQLAKMVGQNTQNYAGAMSNIQSQAMQMLMSGQQLYGGQMLSATLQDLARRAEAEGQSFNIMDILGPLIEAGGTMAAAKLTVACFAEDTPIETVNGNVRIVDVKPDDLVVVEGESKRVKKIFVYDKNPTIKVNDVEVTQCHPFVMADGELMLSGLLKVGDKLYGGRAVEAIEPIKSGKRVCNIEVEGHRYTVGGILVHDGREVRG